MNVGSDDEESGSEASKGESEESDSEGSEGVASGSDSGSDFADAKTSVSAASSTEKTKGPPAKKQKAAPKAKETPAPKAKAKAAPAAKAATPAKKEAAPPKKPSPSREVAAVEAASSEAPSPDAPSPESAAAPAAAPAPAAAAAPAPAPAPAAAPKPKAAVKATPDKTSLAKTEAPKAAKRASPPSSVAASSSAAPKAAAPPKAAAKAAAPAKAAPPKDGVDAVHQYVLDYNAPLNAQMIADRFRGAVSKARRNSPPCAPAPRAPTHHGTPRAQGQADKHLAQLAEAGKIAYKENGKSKIYWADQSGVAELSAQDLQQIDFQCGTLKAERERLAQQVGELQRSLKVQGARKSKAQLLAERSKLEAEVAAAEAELQRQKGPAKAALSTQEAEKVKKLYVMLHKEFRERKRKCIDVIDMLSEQTGDRSAAASKVAAPWPAPQRTTRALRGGAA